MKPQQIPFLKPFKFIPSPYFTQGAPILHIHPNKELLKTVFPDFLFNPQSIQNIAQFPTFLSTIRYFERLTETYFDAIPFEIQNEFILKRLKQLIEICRVNPIWKERIDQAIGKEKLNDFETFSAIPLTDKEIYTDLFSGKRPGMIVPIENGNFQIANSGGTASGRSSEIVFSKKELRDTYRWAGNFIGKHIISRYMEEQQAKWIGTTLSDSQLWSSGTMVGGVLQEIPNVNYLGIGPMSAKIYQRIMQNPGQKGFMGIVRDIAMLVPYASELNDQQKDSLRIALYGSGCLPEKIKSDLKDIYQNLIILSFFAATQAETIGLQLNPESSILTAVPGLHLIEIVDKNGKWVQENEEGDLVVTRLFANEAPVLRYKLGDRVIRRPNYTSRFLNSIQFEYVGRSDDFISLINHQFYVPHFLTLLSKKLETDSIFSFNKIAEEFQFQINQNTETLNLIIAVSNLYEMKNQYDKHKDKICDIMIQSLIESDKKNTLSHSLFEKLKHKCQFNIHFVEKESSMIYRTDVGKTPLIYKKQ